jgi:hypothetical protein
MEKEIKKRWEKPELPKPYSNSEKMPFVTNQNPKHYSQQGCGPDTQCSPLCSPQCTPARCNPERR